MSRWGRGRSGSVAVPLDSALFRENTNCPSAARSAGTVGKWGITSFTSIRSAPYAYQNNVHKKTIHDQNSPLTVPAVETEQPPPKPKKFFKSRNAELFPPVPQITYAPPVTGSHQSPEHSNARDKKTTKRSRYNRDSSSPDLPRRNSEKGKSRKGLATKAAKKDEHSGDTSQPPNKRYLVRNRDRVINYAEDGSNSPIPELTRYESLSHKAPSPKASPLVKCSSPVKVEVASPSTSKDSNEEKKPPPIVLRISKGTSRIVSTDSNEGLTSPSSDRHSSLDTHLDISTGSDNKKSPTVETTSSPKQEGLKITIKCSGINQDAKKEKKKDKKEHKSHKRHHKNNDDEPVKTVSSPLPGSDAYDLYKTLASPTSESDKETSNTKQMDYIESQLAQLDSTTSELKSPDSENQHKDSQPEPKPPESSAGRSRRNRPNINYSENDDDVFASAAKQSSKHVTRTVSDLKKEAKKGRRKQDSVVDTSTPTSTVATNLTLPDSQQGIDKEFESHTEKGDLIDILSGSNDNAKTEGVVPKAKFNKKQKNKQKHLSPEAVVDSQDTVSSQEEQNTVAVEEPFEEEPLMDSVPLIEPIESQIQTQSTDSAYNSCPQELSEEESQKTHQDEIFKSPDHVDSEEQVSEDKPSVKLVITKKKGSIFKSKSLVNDNPSSLPARKRRHLYKHEWAKEKGNETPRPEQSETAEAINPATDDSEELSRVARYRATDTAMDDPTMDEAVTPYASFRGAKEYDTLVRNVKKTRCARQMQEIGENQEFNDDIEYFLDTLQDNNPMSTRCLSAITLASKCTAPAFRMHLRAHGTVQKFFSALHDATNDQSLGLCTATVMFVLSQDRLNMDLDRESLELMLSLLESDVSHKNALDDCGLTSAQLAKTQERVRELCAEIKSKGKAKHLDLENITVGHLAMETLLSLTSKRAGEWFKEELRNLGGVDHIVRTIQDCAAAAAAPAAAWTRAHLDQLAKADRCMRVLENVTQQNEANQQYLVSGSLGAARTLAALLRRCAVDARAHPALQAPLLDAALPAIKVLVNLSHSFGITSSALGAQVVGEQPSLMEICLIMLYNQGNFIPDDKNFDFSVCVLMLLINLVQNNDLNTQRLLRVRIRVDDEHDVISRSVSALDLIVDLFYKRVELARSAEKNTDALLDGEKDDKSDSDNKKQSQDDIEETVAKLLARAGTHMEHTMVGAYLALLLGNMAVAAPTHAQAVRAHVTTYAPMLPTLRKYFDFLTLTASAEAAIVAHVKSTQRIIQFMENSDKEGAAPAPAPAPPAPAPPAAAHRAYAAYETSPSDVPQDMSLSNLNYSMTCLDTSSGSDRMSSSMEIDGYH